MILNVRENVPLAPASTFQIGGNAQYFIDVRSEEDICAAINWAREKDLPFTILSGGSNVLVDDKGIDGLVIHILGNLFSTKDGAVDSWAGTNLLSLIRSMAAQGWGGWEKLSGIPGTVGGALRGNAGAFGPEIKDFVTGVRAINSEDGKPREFTTEECDFSYRHSYFKDHLEWIITRVSLKLSSVAPEEGARLIDETIAEREKRHLQNVRAAGSFFMNPVAPLPLQEMFEKEKGVKSREGRVPAGWLIEKAGMKGAKVGDAISSLQHPNYLVNGGNATAAEVRELAGKIKAAVKEQFEVVLEEEAAVW